MSAELVARLGALQIERGGYVYVATFAERIIKIGQTGEPKLRLRALMTHAIRVLDSQMLDWSLFGPFGNDHSRQLEKMAVLLAASQFKAMPRTREWFVEADAAPIVAFCNDQALSLPAPKPDIRPLCRCSRCRNGYACPTPDHPGRAVRGYGWMA